VADGNIGNFLQRLPGIAGLQEVGDVVGISVRGLPPELNSVSVDGTRSAAASSTIYQASGTQGERAVPIDQIPSDFIKEVEVIKALTPDVPADSLGGTVNLVTKSALDLKESQLNYRLGGNYNSYRKDQRTWKPAGSFTYLTKLGREERLGLAVSGSYNDTVNGRDRIQMTRNLPDNLTNQARTLDDWNSRIRAATSVKFNYRVNAALELSLGVNYTYYSFKYIRNDWNITGVNRVADYSRVSRAQIEAGTQPRDAANQTAGIAPGASGRFTELLHAAFADIGGAGARLSRTYKYDFGFDYRLPGEQKLTVRTSTSPSNFYTAFQTLNAARSIGGIGLAVDSTADIYRPVYRQTYGPTIAAGTDFSAFTATRTLSANTNHDDVTAVKADYEKKFMPGVVSFKFKSGANWQRQYRTQAPYSPTWNYVGADGVAGRNAATGNNDDNLAQFVRPGYGIMNNRYPRRDALDYPAFMKFFEEHPTWFRESGTTVSQGPQYSELTENVSAAYVMGTAQVGKVRLVGGVRAEQTDIDTTGQNRDPRNPTVTRLTSTGEYRNYFPSLHLRYEPSRNLVLRTSYSTGEGRAGFQDIYPATTVTYDQSTGLGIVSQTTPKLKPQYSRNYDLSAEYYTEPAGVLSASYFHKDISDFLARQTDVIGRGADNGFNGQYEGFNLNTTTNAGKATVKGYELNFMHQFVWLPKPFNTLALNANYTKIKTSGSYASGAEELVRFVPKGANVGLSGRYKMLEVRVSYNFKSGYLITYAANPDQRVRTSGVETWDFNVQYKVNRRLTVFVDLVNAFNKWESWYTNHDKARVTMAEVYGTRLNVGLSGRL
jgi:TonB-dependent receptor